MPRHSLAALDSHLSAAAPVIEASPFNLISVVWNYVVSVAGGLIDTPAERDAITAKIMEAYDAATLAVTKTNAILGVGFAAARPTVKAAIDFMLASFAPAPAPQPVPSPAPSTEGAAT